MTGPCLRPNSVIDRLERAQGHLGAAQVQRIPSDDQIIAGHVDDARDILLDVLRELRRQAADPVIDWPRPSYYQRAKGRPVPDGPGMRGEDSLPEDVA